MLDVKGTFMEMQITDDLWG